ncbi:hypothetical protein IH601_11865 [Candidatus Bipolaricaulota bacterium]|nr:hypothetical protein [Candidatus Bipolaricaulota bacterium]TFH06891.1 MAG: hypothetical protein E4H08_10360 [Candidatus Atribacteria bacterium]
MKIACCTMEMVALIFLLFLSINGGYSYLNNTPRTDFVSRPTTELITAWGEPDTVIAANELGFLSTRIAEVEVWSYDNPARSVIVRDDIVVSIRLG